MVNITKETEKFIQNKPYIKQALKNNLINYSKLARMISKDKKINNVDSIIVASRRYQEKIKRNTHTPDILGLLKNTNLNIKNKIIVTILKPNTNQQSISKIQEIVEKNNDFIHIIKSLSGTTIVTTEEYVNDIKNIFKNRIIKTSKGLVEITMKSSIRLESIPGVMGHIYSLFGENDINIVETISCWKDTLLVIEEKDLAKTMELLDFS